MIRGVDVFPDGRCKHYYSGLDVVAFRFACCEGAWACRECHNEIAGHDAQLWDPTDPRPAVLCGACGFAQTAKAYLGRSDEQCPCCTHPWNPNCREHEALYFATD